MAMIAATFLQRAALLALGAVLGACAVAPATRCAPGAQPMVNETLYFGTDIPGTGNRVGSDDWQRFLAEVVTPHFPEGLSAWPASGQWRGTDGVIVREDSYVLQVLHDGSPAKRDALDDIGRAYKERFRQEAVLRTTTPMCMQLL